MTIFWDVNKFTNFSSIVYPNGVKIDLYGNQLEQQIPILCSLIQQDKIDTIKVDAHLMPFEKVINTFLKQKYSYNKEVKMEAI